MQRIKLVLEYDGSGYNGWQIQTGQKTIQQELEHALFVLFKQEIRVTAAGRTDTGVHARNQVVHCNISDADLFRLKQSLNGLLNRDIVVKEISITKPDFHARFDATARLYRYHIATEVTALNRDYAWTVRIPLNLTLLQVAAKIIPGYEDFKSFCKTKSEVNNHICTILTSRWIQQNGLLVYEIQANRFLHGMVRAIVGTLIEVGKGKVSLQDFKRMIEARDRRAVPATAPAHGLVLEKITY